MEPLKSWRNFLLGICAATATVSAMAQSNQQARWADSVLRTLTLRQMVAQSMMVATWSNKDAAHVQQIEDLIYKERIGGLIFFQGTTRMQAWRTNYFQQISKVPLMIGIDGEWGLAMRLSDAERYPYTMTLGAAGNEDLAFRTGAAMGRECRRIGVQINFAPVVDLNTNPRNPIIGFRSFGDRREVVSRLANALARGMQSEGVMACAKHFPGHGDTEADSHLDLPLLSHSRERLDSVELYPFRQLIVGGVDAVMVGHLQVPALDSAQNRPSSLSRPMVQGLLREKMAFGGLIVTDALNMKGVARFFPPGIAEREAYLAGNDILLFPENPSLGLDLICQAVDSGLIDSAQVAARAYRILWYKAKYGLAHWQPVNTSHLDLSLTANNQGEWMQEAAELAITLVKDQHRWMPLNANVKGAYASLAVGKKNQYVFQRELTRFHRTDRFLADRNASALEWKALLDTLKLYPFVSVSLHDAGLWGKKAVQVPEGLLSFLMQLKDSTRLVLVNFGNVYQLGELGSLPCIVAAYEDHEAFQRQAAGAIYGQAAFRGHLPARINEEFQRGAGIATNNHLFPALPVSCASDPQPDSAYVSRIDKMLDQIVRTAAAPGGQLLVMHHGRIVLERNFGFSDYKHQRPVQIEDVYDLASLTKTAATTLVTMKLWEEDKLSLDDALENYLPEFAGTNKAGITIRQLMLHEAGLEAWIPFYKELIQTPEYLYDQSHAGCGCFQIAENLYLDSVYLRVVWDRIKQSPVGPRGQYKYSDLSMILLQRILEQVGGDALDRLADQYFYQPMGLQKMTFRPLERFDPHMVAPTSDDGVFRKQVIKGYVHDPAAALLGGVAGHAGLFGNASDVAAIFQMLLDGGIYNGKRLLQAETVQRFTRRQHTGSRRGLGFDKPEPNPRLPNPASSYCSPETFGHTGFTGTCAWADPRNGLVFVFLSNRVHPSEENNALVRGNYRTELQRLVYESLR